MTVLMWCVVVGCALPYVAHLPHMWAKWRTGQYERNYPRSQSQALEGFGARAYGAHTNAFEAIVVFAPVALIAHVVGVDPVVSGWLGIGWVAARLAHMGFYLGNIPRMRSAMFGLANLFALGLVGLAALGNA